MGWGRSRPRSGRVWPRPSWGATRWRGGWRSRRPGRGPRPRWPRAVRSGFGALADRELARRTEHTVAARIQTAKFVRVQTVDTFNFEYNAATRKLRSRELDLLAPDLVAEGIGALFVGGSGVGKTHLARGLGRASCQWWDLVLL